MNGKIILVWNNNVYVFSVWSTELIIFADITFMHL